MKLHIKRHADNRKDGNTIPEVRELTKTESYSAVDEDLEFPEGGIQANLVLFGSFMGLLPVYGLLGSSGVIQAYVSEHQLASVSTSTVSWIFSLNVFVSYSTGTFSGTYFDRNGAKLPMCLGTLLFVGGLFATANASSVYQFILAFGVTNGIGSGLLLFPLIAAPSHYFKKRRATATSIATTGDSIGGVAFPLILRSLYPKVGFIWTIRILGFICLFALIWSVLLVKERITNRPQNEDLSKKITARQCLHIYVVDVFDYRYLFEAKFIFCAFGIALSETSLLISLVYLPSYAIQMGFSESTGYLLLTIVNATGILGRYVPGYVADNYLGSFNVMIITLVFSVILSFVMWLPFGSNLKVLYSFCALYGFCTGSIFTLSPVCCGKVSRTDQFGKRYSTVNLIAALFILAGLPIAGVIINSGSVRTYNYYILYSTMLCVGSIICHIAARVTCVGLKLCKF